MNNEQIPQDDPILLFNKVIESNHENILTNQATLIAISNFEKLTALEEERRKKFAESVPNNMEIRITDEHLEIIKSWDKKMLESKILHFLLFGAVTVSLLIAVVSGYFAEKFYSASVKAKSELRQEVLEEIKTNGKAIYIIDEVKQLQHNTELMNKWMQKNPKDAEKFLRFKDGYESR